MPESQGAIELTYEMVIGLEIHTQLSTRTKMFCGCVNAFGGESNTHVCPVCLGYPGALPVANASAVASAVRLALALDCDIQELSRFDRKNYFYPDLPKGYQISQFYHPYARGGAIPFDGDDGNEKKAALVQIHIEEDAGKSIHDDATNRSKIDLNRCGTPLLEIVTQPVLASATEASSCMRSLRDLLRWLQISDVNMEEGSLRCDVNISLRAPGSSELGTRTEIKNLNSFQSVEGAVAVESLRQQEILDSGESVTQETRLFDADRGITLGMRGKEEAHDYRYFPEPDLLVLRIPPDLIEEQRSRLIELPRQRRSRYQESLHLTPTDAAILTSRREYSDFFEKMVVAGASPGSAANWFKGEILRHLNDLDCSIDDYPLEAEAIAKVIAAVEGDRISVAQGRDVLKRALADGKSPEEVLAGVGEQVSDSAALESWVSEVIASNAEAVAKISGGDEKPLQFLMGQVMKLSRGKANPRLVVDMLKEKIDSDGQ